MRRVCTNKPVFRIIEVRFCYLCLNTANYCRVSQSNQSWSISGRDWTCLEWWEDYGRKAWALHHTNIHTDISQIINLPSIRSEAFGQKSLQICSWMQSLECFSLKCQVLCGFHAWSWRYSGHRRKRFWRLGWMCYAQSYPWPGVNALPVFANHVLSLCNGESTIFNYCIFCIRYTE